MFAGKEPVAGRFCSEEHFLCPFSPPPQLRDKERQMIKERFKVSWGPPPSTAPCGCCRDTGPESLSLGHFCIHLFLVARVSMMALKNYARSRRPGLFLTWSRETRFAKLRKTLSGRPTGPFCTGEPSVSTSPALCPSLPLLGLCSVPLEGNTDGRVGVGGRASVLGFAVGPDRAVTQGHPVRSALG